MISEESGDTASEPRADRPDGPSADDRADEKQSGENQAADPIDARVFRVIGEQLLARPEVERVEAVASWAAQWRAAANSLPPEIEIALERIEAGADDDIDTLRTAYTHLFRGVSERAPDPPYESMYADGSFYSETTTQIRKGYRWAGLDVDGALGNEPPDHLGLELQFLGELIAMTERGEVVSPDADGSDAVQAQEWLLDGHLLEWVPSYHARVQQADPHAYYAGLLDLTLAALHHQSDSLE